MKMMKPQVHRLMMQCLVVVLCLCLCLFSGCGPKNNLHLVYIIDLSSSIEPEARAEAFSAMQQVFERQQLERGDTISIVPVTGDALADGQGRVLRFVISERRAAYDADLRRIAREAISRLQEMQSASAAQPYTKSDILGALNTAVEEFANAEDGERKVIVVLSDLAQDDARCNFSRSPHMANERVAREFAATLVQGREQMLSGTAIYFGLLRSTDMRQMTVARREAVQAFWVEYCRRANAASVSIATDGPAQLTQALIAQK